MADDDGAHPYRPPGADEAALGGAAPEPMAAPLPVLLVRPLLVATVLADLAFSVFMIPACGSDIATRFFLWGMIAVVVEILLLCGVNARWRRVRWHLPLWFVARELPAILPTDRCMPGGSTVACALWVFGLHGAAFAYVGLCWLFALWFACDRGVAAWFADGERVGADRIR